jgi:hypothetical protein
MSFGDNHEPEAAQPCAVDKHAHPATDRQGRPTGHRLCARHLKQIADDLRTIERESRDLDPRPSMATNLDGRGGGKSTPAFQQTPARLDPIVLSDRRRGEGWWEDAEDALAAGNTTSVLSVLNRHANRVRAGRKIEIPLVWVVDLIPGKTLPSDLIVCPTPCIHKECRAVAWWRSAPEPPTIAGECALLSRPGHLEWIAGQEWVAQFHHDVRALRAQLQQANGTSSPKPLPGKCPVQIRPGEECGGPLWPTKPKYTSGEPKWTGSAPSAIQCSSCRSRWQGAGPIARLALILEAQRKAKAS